MNYFSSKTIWIIGASSGIGKELAIQLSQLGANLILSGRNTTQLNEVASQLVNKTNNLVLPLDLEMHSNFDEKVETILQHFTTIDILFNNGGISQRSEVYNTSIEVERRIMEINYFGNIALTKALLPHFRKQKKGQLIITSSIAGKFGFFLRSSYSASKHALHGYYESLRLEELNNNISVTMLCPGKINTEISKNALTGQGRTHNIMDHNQSTGMPVEKCVHKILVATKNQKKEVYIGNKEILVVYIKRYLPWLFWKIIKKQKAT
ncbi:MAG: SDR family oxidoreductase [Crocinitomicaceae bacterium]|nr:SDR family oxidoreductase [Crocinitomicaceae bacterium]